MMARASRLAVAALLLSAFACAATTAPRLRVLQTLHALKEPCHRMERLQDGTVVTTNGVDIFFHTTENPGTPAVLTPAGGKAVMAVAGTLSPNPSYTYTIFYWPEGGFVQTYSFTLEVVKSRFTGRDTPYVRTYSEGSVGDGPLAPVNSGSAAQRVSLKATRAEALQDVLMVDDECGVYSFVWSPNTTEQGYVMEDWTSPTTSSACSATVPVRVVFEAVGDYLNVVTHASGRQAAFMGSRGIHLFELGSGAARVRPTVRQYTSMTDSPNALPILIAYDDAAREVGAVAVLFVLMDAATGSYELHVPDIGLLAIDFGRHFIAPNASGRSFDVTVTEMEWNGTTMYFAVRVDTYVQSTDSSEWFLFEYSIGDGVLFGRTPTAAVASSGLSFHTTDSLLYVCTAAGTYKFGASRLDECAEDCPSCALEACSGTSMDCIDDAPVATSLGDWHCVPRVLDECDPDIVDGGATVCTAAEQICFDPEPYAHELGTWQCRCANAPYFAARQPAKCPWDECVNRPTSVSGPQQTKPADLCAAADDVQICVDPTPVDINLNDWMCVCVGLGVLGTRRTGVADCHTLNVVTPMPVARTPTPSTDSHNIDVDECLEGSARAVCQNISSETRQFVCVDPNMRVRGDTFCHEWTRDECTSPCVSVAGGAARSVVVVPTTCGDVCSMYGQRCRDVSTRTVGDWQCHCNASEDVRAYYETVVGVPYDYSPGEQGPAVCPDSVPVADNGTNSLVEASAPQDTLSGSAPAEYYSLLPDTETLANTITGASVLGGDALAGTTFLVASGACGVTETDPLSLLLHPTQLRVRGSHPLGMLIGNLALVATVAVLLVVLVHVVKAAQLYSPSVKQIDPWGACLFPSVPLFVFAFLLPGIALGCMVTAVEPPDYLFLFLAILGGLVCIVVPVCVWYRVSVDIPRYAGYKSNPTRAKKYHWLIGAGEWVSVSRSNHWANRYCLIVRPLRPEAKWFFVVDHVMAIGIACVHAIPMTGDTLCGNIKVLAAVMYFLKLGLEVYFKPSSRSVTGWLRILACGTQFTAMVFYAMHAYEVHDGVWNVATPSEGAAATSAPVSARAVSFARENTVRALVVSWVLLAVRITAELMCEGYIVLTGGRQRMQEAEFNVDFTDDVCITPETSDHEGEEKLRKGKGGLSDHVGSDVGQLGRERDRGFFNDLQHSKNPLCNAYRASTPFLMPKHAMEGRSDTEPPPQFPIAHGVDSESEPTADEQNNTITTISDRTRRRVAGTEGRGSREGYTSVHEPLASSSDEKKLIGGSSAQLLHTPSPSAKSTSVSALLREMRDSTCPTTSKSFNNSGACKGAFASRDETSGALVAVSAQNLAADDGGLEALSGSLRGLNHTSVSPLVGAGGASRSRSTMNILRGSSTAPGSTTPQGGRSARQASIARDALITSAGNNSGSTNDEIGRARPLSLLEQSPTPLLDPLESSTTPLTHALLAGHTAAKSSVLGSPFSKARGDAPCPPSPSPKDAPDSNAGSMRRRAAALSSPAGKAFSPLSLRCTSGNRLASSTLPVATAQTRANSTTPTPSKQGRASPSVPYGTSQLLPSNGSHTPPPPPQQGTQGVSPANNILAATNTVSSLYTTQSQGPEQRSPPAPPLDVDSSSRPASPPAGAVSPAPTRKRESLSDVSSALPSPLRKQVQRTPSQQAVAKQVPGQASKSIAL